MPNDFTRTDRELPESGRPIEWLAPSGEIVRGTLVGTALWMLEGSAIYVYYTPQFWRYV